MRPAITAFLLVLLWGTAALANAGRPWDPGDPLAEPIARIPNVSITSEKLVIDGRAFETGGHASVTATYRVLCSATAGATVPLVFVAPGIEGGSVELDGRALKMEARGLDALPESWRSPDVTPDSIRGHLQYAEPIGRVLSFTADFPRGEHELTVRYDARPTLHHGRTLVAMQLAYVLAPARDWGGFGSLDVEVLAPEGWTLDVTPALSAAGDGRWHQSFDGLPADALSMTFRPPTPVARELIPYLFLVLSLLLCLVAGRKVGGALALRFSGCAPALAGGFVVGALGATLAMGAWYLGLSVMASTLPEALLSRDTDYAQLGVAALALLFGFVLTAAGAAYGRHKAAQPI